MKRILILISILILASSPFLAARPAYAAQVTMPRNAYLTHFFEMDGCTYRLQVEWREYLDKRTYAWVAIDNQCDQSILLYYDKVVRKSEYSLPVSLKSAHLKTRMLDQAMGKTGVVLDLKIKAVGSKPKEESYGALVTGKIVFPELGLTFFFDREPVGGFAYGT
jgi:hypothetical protein